MQNKRLHCSELHIISEHTSLQQLLANGLSHGSWSDRDRATNLFECQMVCSERVECNLKIFGGGRLFPQCLRDNTSCQGNRGDDGAFLEKEF